MNRLVKRTKNFLWRIWKNLQSDSKFSLYYSLLRVVDEIGRLLGKKIISQWASDKRNFWIQAYLQKQLMPIIEKYTDAFECGTNSLYSPIWVCWWTGMDTAPELVHRCVESIYRNAGNHPVHLITKDNYSNYVAIPKYMLDKAAAGKMGLAHLADYLRVKLLHTYGGLWLDATMFCSQNIPQECFSSPVFTLKGPVQKCGYVSDLRWVTFCLGGWRGNTFYHFLVEAFEEYWRNNDYAIDYLFFDYIILLGYTQIPAIGKWLDSIPDNNIHRDALQTAMNAALPATDFESVLQQDTALYKLSWRETYAKQSNNGELSVYGYFLGL